MLSVFAALALGSGIAIGGSAQCPTATQVSERLQDLMPKASARSDRATLEEHDGELHIELHGADGSFVGGRTLAARGSCTERAQAVAVTIAAWEGDLDVGNGPPRLPSPQIETQV